MLISFRRKGLLCPIPVFSLCLLLLLLLWIWYHGIDKHLFIQIIRVHVEYFVLIFKGHSKIKVIIVCALRTWSTFWCFYFSNIISVYIHICALSVHLIGSVALAIRDNISWKRAPNFLSMIINWIGINLFRPAWWSRVVPCKLICLFLRWEVIIKGSQLDVITWHVLLLQIIVIWIVGVSDANFLCGSSIHDLIGASGSATTVYWGEIQFNFTLSGWVLYSFSNFRCVINIGLLILCLLLNSFSLLEVLLQSHVHWLRRFLVLFLGNDIVPLRMTFGHLVGMAYGISVLIRSQWGATRLWLLIFLETYREKTRLGCHCRLNLVFLFTFIFICKEAIGSFALVLKVVFVLWLGTTSRKSIGGPCKGDLVSWMPLSFTRVLWFWR